jgi:hypothetical protein
MSTIAHLLETDEINAKQTSTTLLRELDTDAPDVFEHVELLFKAFAEVAGEGDEPLIDQLRAIAIELGLSDQGLHARLESDDSHPRVVLARRLFRIAWARQASRIVFSLCWRQFRWGATDLRRLRVVAAYGYLRQQAESVALLQLFEEDPEIAAQWMSLDTSESGRQFFRATQSALKDRMRRLELDRPYEVGSSVALHVRYASSVRGRWNIRGYGGLKDQDVDPDDLYSYHLALTHFAQTEHTVLKALSGGFPECDTASWRAKLNEFGQRVAAIRRRLELKYPDHLIHEA